MLKEVLKSAQTCDFQALHAGVRCAVNTPEGKYLVTDQPHSKLKLFHT
jgi:hypothetical protein